MIAGFAFAVGVMAQSAVPAVTASSDTEYALRMIAAMKRAVFTAGVCERHVRPGGNLDQAISSIFVATGQPIVDAANDEIRAELARGRQDPRRDRVTAPECQHAIVRRMAELRTAIDAR